MKITNSLRRKYLKDLQARCNQMFGTSKYDLVYRPGIWSGILNALDENSPRAVGTLKEAAMWHREGVEYLNRLTKRAADVGWWCKCGWPNRDDEETCTRPGCEECKHDTGYCHYCGTYTSPVR